MNRSYSELIQFDTFLDRFRYLSLQGKPGDITYGFERYVNQQFYHSREWRRIRNFVIDRDNGCDLGIEGFEIHARLVIHHINPMRIGDSFVKSLQPEFLITTTHNTHNAIHYGDESLLIMAPVERKVGDTKLW